LSHINFKHTFIHFAKINTLSLLLLFPPRPLSLILLSLYHIILLNPLKLKIPFITLFRVSYIINPLNSIIPFPAFIPPPLTP
ncbi:hypothetical protein, partial [Staphylococcus epidermidis]|uniref:hypothetical protein n=1 Tax=Staphylococcus epidermidis TaxID=1282 RepID=UPI0011A94C69